MESSHKYSISYLDVQLASTSQLDFGPCSFCCIPPIYCYHIAVSSSTPLAFFLFRLFACSKRVVTSIIYWTVLRQLIAIFSLSIFHLRFILLLIFRHTSSLGFRRFTFMCSSFLSCSNHVSFVIETCNRVHLIFVLLSANIL